LLQEESLSWYFVISLAPDVPSVSGVLPCLSALRDIGSRDGSGIGTGQGLLKNREAGMQNLTASSVKVI
jgi:hypothetical protein